MAVRTIRRSSIPPKSSLKKTIINDFDSTVKLGNKTSNRIVIGTLDPPSILDDVLLYVYDGYITTENPSGEEVTINPNIGVYGDPSTLYFRNTNTSTGKVAIGVAPDYIWIDSNGNVGIDEPNPGARLDVNGLMRATDSTGVPTTGKGLELYYSTGSDFAVVQAYDRGSATWEKLRINNLVFFDSSDKVGIGTSSPSARFDVVGLMRTTNTAGTPTTGKGLETFYSTTSDLAGIQAYDRDNSSWEKIRINNLMWFNGSDNVGIGTSSPDTKLHVYNNQTIGGSQSNRNNASLLLADSTVGLYMDSNEINTMNVSTGAGSDLFIQNVNGAGDTILNQNTGNVLVGKSSSNLATTGIELHNDGEAIITRSGSPLSINRENSDGALINFYQDGSFEGRINVSGSTVSLQGASMQHESSGIPTDTPKGTVVSTIDSLDFKFKEGEIVDREDHPQAEVSNKVADKRVYGVVQSFNGGKVIVTSTGIGSILVTGSCQGGDLLESNGDGTARVQADNIIRSSTIAKVSVGNQGEGAKLVSCIMML